MSLSLVSCQSLEGYYSSGEEDIQAYCRSVQNSLKGARGLKGKKTVSAKTFYMCLVEGTGHRLQIESMNQERGARIILWSIGISALAGTALWISKTVSGILPAGGSRARLPSP